LRGEYEERLAELVAYTAGGNMVLLHCFEQCGLGLGRRAVDLVGKNNVCENRAFDKNHLSFAVGLLEYFGAGYVRGHKVGCELDPLELQVKQLGQRFDKQCLGQTRGAGDKAVPAGENRDEQVLDDVLLAYDDL
jgi:hypothetical protein